MSKVEDALIRIHDAITEASKSLSDSEYDEFLGELCADAEGWNMALNERRRDKEKG